MGNEKEQIAVSYLISNDYQIIFRNYRTNTGEIDIIAIKNNTIVFIEVKYRKNANYGYPQEAVTYNKQQTIRNTALYFMYKNNISPDTGFRFDVINILGNEITHIENAF